MSDLDKHTIETLTQLSHIGCTEEEQEALLSDLKQVLDYVNQLQEIDSSQVAPCYTVLADLVNVMREDIVCNSSCDILLANAPLSSDGLIHIPVTYNHP